MLTTSVSSVVDASPAAVSLAGMNRDSRGTTENMRSGGNTGNGVITQVYSENGKSASTQVSSPQLDPKEVKSATERLQANVDTISRKLQFKVEEDSLQVLVIDRETEEVIRSIPPDQILKASEKLKEFMGLLIDTTV